MDAWTHGHMDTWAHGRMDTWTHTSMDAHNHGRMYARKHVLHLNGAQWLHLLQHEELGFDLRARDESNSHFVRYELVKSARPPRAAGATRAARTRAGLTR